MILEHEIPKGSKLHFGLSARFKRDIENLSTEIFYKHGFDEIVSPIFVYQEHQRNFLNRDIIQLSSELNNQIAMRNDSTIEVMRIISKRLGRSTTQKKWFYIQPFFSYPTTEHNQIGAECLDEDRIYNMLMLGIEIVNKIGIKPLLQITNTKIAKLCANELDIDILHFNRLNLLEIGHVDFINKLLAVNTPKDLESIISSMPTFLRDELEYLLHSCVCDYFQILCSPLFPSPVDYYDDIFFRMFMDNATLLSGGRYCVDGVKSCGFGIYTDNIIYHLLKDKG